MYSVLKLTYFCLTYSYIVTLKIKLDYYYYYYLSKFFLTFNSKVTLIIYLKDAL